MLHHHVCCPAVLQSLRTPLIRQQQQCQLRFRYADALIVGDDLSDILYYRDSFEILRQSIHLCEHIGLAGHCRTDVLPKYLIAVAFALLCT